MTFTAALLVAGGGPAFAHDPGLSSLDVVVEHGQVVVMLSMSPEDARLLTVAQGAAPEPLAVEKIDLRVDGVTLAGRVVERTVSDADVSVRLLFERIPGMRMSVRSGIAASMPRGHRQLLRISAPDGRRLAERMLDAQTGDVDVDLEHTAAAPGTALPFFRLGLVHILEGYDHLLFLCALLLAARGLKDVLKTTTAFTAGHSITLALAALGIVVVPAGIVEPAIALSIIWAGVESLRAGFEQDASARGRDGRRWIVAGAFGLVHGFGFAGALRDLGIATSSSAIVLPLGSFNAGVEAGQIAVAALVWPALRRIDARPALRLRVAPACSVLIVLAGTYWFVERTLL